MGSVLNERSKKAGDFDDNASRSFPLIPSLTLELIHTTHFWQFSCGVATLCRAIEDTGSQKPRVSMARWWDWAFREFDAKRYEGKLKAGNSATSRRVDETAQQSNRLTASRRCPVVTARLAGT